MSDDSAPTPETSTTPPVKGTPRDRRASSPRPKKQAKVSKATDVTAADLAPSSPKSSKFPEFSESSAAPEAPSIRGDWPEPEAATSGASASPENPKRKRRRKKGKGNGPQVTVVQTEDENPPQVSGESAETVPSQSLPQSPRPTQQPRPKLDADALAKRAWKIYLAEISEEGVALVGDNDAKELSRRCFRLAEIFMEEQARRR